VFAWAQNRHAITGWYGAGSGLAGFVEVRGERGEALLRRMFRDCWLFRLLLNELEKTLVLVDLSIPATMPIWSPMRLRAKPSSPR